MIETARVENELVTKKAVIACIEKWSKYIGLNVDGLNIAIICLPSEEAGVNCSECMKRPDE